MYTRHEWQFTCSERSRSETETQISFMKYEEQSWKKEKKKRERDVRIGRKEGGGGEEWDGRTNMGEPG